MLMSIEDKKTLILCACNQNLVKSSYNELHNNFMAQVTRRGTVTSVQALNESSLMKRYYNQIALTYGLSQVFELATSGRPDDSKAGKYGAW